MRIESERDQARCIEGLRRERGMGEGRRGASKLRNAARKMVVACGSFSKKQGIVDPVIITDPTTTSNATVLRASATHPKKQGRNISEIAEEAESSSSLATKNLCAICLDPLNYSSRNSSPGQAIFTAQCSHAFHFACISSNVRHGSVTCPICRAHWTQLPRNLNPPCSRSCNLQTDPVLQILDDSIATFRVHRRSFLRSARYDDDDPIEPYDHNPNHPRLTFSLVHAPSSHQSFQPSSVHPSWQVSYHPHGTSPLHNITSAGLLSQLPPAGNLAAIGQPPYQSASNRAYLSVKMAYQQATDLVLVASPNGPHLRLLKQCMSLAVFSLRSIDRLAIVAYSSAAARVFPLRRMTSYGKRAALQVIDRLFYMGQADPFEGLKKGLKILEDRAHKNPWSCILHMSDSPARPYCAMDMEVPIPIHRFHVGFGLGTSSGLVMHEFEEFLARMLGGVIRETQLWIGDQEGRMMVRLGEVRSGEERRIALNMQGEGRHIVYVGYSYIDGGLDECNITTGETLVGVHEKRETSADDYDDPEGTGRDGSIGGRTSSAEGWDYHDPHMARRWAKHLHGYRL